MLFLLFKDPRQIVKAGIEAQAEPIHVALSSAIVGLGYLGKDSKADFKIWQLAVVSDKEVRSIADFFGLQYQVDETDKTLINHSLITAVISPEGKVTKILKGNEWSSADLLRELKTAAEAK